MIEFFFFFFLRNALIGCSEDIRIISLWRSNNQRPLWTRRRCLGTPWWLVSGWPSSWSVQSVGSCRCRCGPWWECATPLCCCSGHLSPSANGTWRRSKVVTMSSSRLPVATHGTHLVSHDASVWTTSQLSVELSWISTVMNVFSLCNRRMERFAEERGEEPKKKVCRRSLPCLRSVSGSLPRTWRWPRPPAGPSGNVRMSLLPSATGLTCYQVSSLLTGVTCVYHVHSRSPLAPTLWATSSLISGAEELLSCANI